MPADRMPAAIRLMLTDDHTNRVGFDRTTKFLASVCAGGLVEAPAPLLGPAPPAAARAPCVAPVAVDPFACRKRGFVISGFVIKTFLCWCSMRCKRAVAAVDAARGQVQDLVRHVFDFKFHNACVRFV